MRAIVCGYGVADNAQPKRKVLNSDAQPHHQMSSKSKLTQRWEDWLIDLADAREPTAYQFYAAAGR